MRRAALALLLALAACGDRGANEETHPAIAANEDSTIGPGGAAGISTALAMDVETIRAAAPNFSVAAVEDQIEGDPFTAITLSSGGEEVFRIYPTADRGHVHAITTRSAQARGPAGDIAGRSLFADAPAEEASFCASEYVDGAAGFGCSTAADGRFWRIYKLPDAYDGPSDPFDAIDPDVLHDSLLVEMRWVAPRVGESNE